MLGITKGPQCSFKPAGGTEVTSSAVASSHKVSSIMTKDCLARA
jgi:hypothetical protein